MPRRPVRLALHRLDDRLVPAFGLDPTFGDIGRLTTDAPPGGDLLGYNGSGVAIGPDGGVLAATNPGGGVAVSRRTPLGQPDPSFGVDGRAEFRFQPPADYPSVRTWVRGMTVQPDGKVLVVGDVLFQRFGPTPPPDLFGSPRIIETFLIPTGQDVFVVRFNADGSVDTSFGTGGAVTLDFSQPGPDPYFRWDTGYDVAVGADGAVVVSAQADDRAWLLPTGGQLTVARLTPAGALDATFGDAGVATVTLPAVRTTRVNHGLTVRPDGSVYGLVSADPQADAVVFRLTAAGRPDDGFGQDGLAVVAFGLTTPSWDIPAGFVVDADGRVVLAATAFRARPDGFTGRSTEVGVARLTADGQLDPTFGGDGRVNYEFAPGAVDSPAGGVLVRSDGRVVVTGAATFTPTPVYNSDPPARYDAAFLGLTADGGLDPDFGTGGRLVARFPGGVAAHLVRVAELADGRMLGVGIGNTGDASPFTLSLVRLVEGGVQPVIEPVPQPQPEPVVVPEPLPEPEPEPRFESVQPIVVVAQPVAETPAPTSTPAPNVVTDGPRVSVVGADGAILLPAFAPFEASYAGDLNAVLADTDGDGTPELVVAPDAGGGPVVAVYRLDGTQVARFFGIEDDAFRGGARVAAGDLDGDGTADLVVTAGDGGGPRVAVFDGKRVAGDRRKLVPDFFAFEEAQRGGANVAAGDVTGDGRADLVFGGGNGGGPRVTVLDGRDLIADGKPRAVFDQFVGDADRRDGVRVRVMPEFGGRAVQAAPGGDSASEFTTVFGMLHGTQVA